VKKFKSKAGPLPTPDLPLNGSSVSRHVDFSILNSTLDLKLEFTDARRNAHPEKQSEDPMSFFEGLHDPPNSYSHALRRS
jgi:hypothetical protein